MEEKEQHLNEIEYTYTQYLGSFRGLSDNILWSAYL